MDFEVQHPESRISLAERGCERLLTPIPALRQARRRLSKNSPARNRRVASSSADSGLDRLTERISLMFLYGNRANLNEFVPVMAVCPMPPMAVPIPRVVIMPVSIIPIMIPTVFISSHGK